MDERLLRQAAAHGPEFVRHVLQLEATLKHIAHAVQQAHQATPSDYALAPPPIPDTHPPCPPAH